MNFFFLWLFFFSIYKSLFSEQMMMVLLSIEMIMVNIFFFTFNLHFLWFSNSLIVSIFLFFMVCESVLGLGIYIYISRLAGNDSFKSVNMLK